MSFQRGSASVAIVALIVLALGAVGAFAIWGDSDDGEPDVIKERHVEKHVNRTSEEDDGGLDIDIDLLPDDDGKENKGDSENSNGQ